MKISIWFVTAVFMLSAFAFAAADTIRATDGKELKGIVVEDYKDRIVFSTVDGEITVMKMNMSGIRFDAPEENLVLLAEQAKEGRDYGRALAYYRLALNVNPECKPARNGIVFIQGYLWRQDEVRKEDEIKRQQDLERTGGFLSKDTGDKETFEKKAEKLKRTLGLVLVSGKGRIKVDKVDDKSPADEAGIRRGDELVAIWGKLTGYMELGEVLDILLDKPALEIKCTIERSVDVSPRNEIGASFSMEFDGLTVSGLKENGASYASGVRTGDLITVVDGQSTRYMPLKNAIELIRDSQNDSVKLILRREALMWRRD